MQTDSEDVIRIASVYDPAIDAYETSQDDLRAFARDRTSEAASRIKLHQGQTLATFHVRRIGYHAFTHYVKAAPSLDQKYERAFQCGVTQIDNVPWPDLPPGTSVRPTGRVPTAVGFHPAWTDEELAALGEPAYVEDIGRVAYARGFLPRRTEVSFPVPLTLREDLITLAALRAGVNLRNAEAQLRKQRASSSDPSSAPASDAATSAPVTDGQTGSSDSPSPEPASTSERSRGSRAPGRRRAPGKRS